MSRSTSRPLVRILRVGTWERQARLALLEPDHGSVRHEDEDLLPKGLARLRAFCRRARMVLPGLFDAMPARPVG
jgi:hypothetical protein